MHGCWTMLQLLAIQNIALLSIVRIFIGGLCPQYQVQANTAGVCQHRAILDMDIT